MKPLCSLMSGSLKLECQRKTAFSGVDGSGPGVRIHLGGPRQCLRVYILPDVRQFAISIGNVEDAVVFKRPIRHFDICSVEYFKRGLRAACRSECDLHGRHAFRVDCDPFL